MPQTQGPPDLGVALDGLADRCDAAVESLLLALPVAGDRVTQRVVDDFLDQVMDVLRMLSVTGRETRERLPAAAAGRPCELPEAPRPTSWSRPSGWAR